MKMLNGMAYSGGHNSADISGMQNLCRQVVETEEEEIGRDEFLEGLIKDLKGFQFILQAKRSFECV